MILFTVDLIYIKDALKVQDSAEYVKVEVIFTFLMYVYLCSICRFLSEQLHMVICQINLKRNSTLALKLFIF